MFDQLVESTRQGQTNKRTGMFLFATTAIYGIAIIVLAVVTVFWFSPELMGALNVEAMIAPPEPPKAEEPAPPEQIIRNVPDTPEFQPPQKVTKIPEATTVPPKRMVAMSTGVPGGVPGGLPGGAPGPSTRDETPPPPPPPPPPTPTPTPRPAIHKVSGGVLPGLAIKKVTPPYPAIARTARASGAVTVLVLISEEGRVISAEVQSGHPLLKEAALQAAKQWIFKPTELTGVPVKVQGILTFNFALQ
jgi:periplasmic protein TonB